MFEWIKGENHVLGQILNGLKKSADIRLAFKQFQTQIAVWKMHNFIQMPRECHDNTDIKTFFPPTRDGFNQVVEALLQTVL